MRILLVFLILLASPLYAAQNPSSILIVDVKRILDESHAAVGAQKKIEAQRRLFQEEIAAQEKRIREAESELLSLRGKLNAQQYEEKENSLRQSFRDVEKYVQERRQTLEKATTTSVGKVRDVLLDIVTDMAKKRGAQAVLVKQQVLWTAEGLDVTDEVLTTLNQKLPELAVSIEAPKLPTAKAMPNKKDKP